jgi:hypothetical protein
MAFTTMELGATLPGVPLYEALGYAAVERIDEPLPDGESAGDCEDEEGADANITLSDLSTFKKLTNLNSITIIAVDLSQRQ